MKKLLPSKPRSEHGEYSETGHSQDMRARVLSAKPSSWDDFFDAKSEGAEGFLGRRNDRPPQKRRLLR